MARLAVVGRDVSRSKSPEIHSFLLGEFGTACEYDKLSIAPEAFDERAEELFSRYDLFNVTIPFKRAILPHLARTEGDAARFGAVNTVLTRTRTGYNTDGEGFSLMLAGAGIAAKGARALVLGAGGAGRSCVAALLRGGAEVSLYSRTYARTEETYGKIGGFRPLSALPEEEFDLVVNCTGVGMHATEGTSPVGAETLARCACAIDLIYEPARSEFLRIAESLGKRTENGAAMLFYQAYYADCILLGRAESAREAKKLYLRYREVNG